MTLVNISRKRRKELAFELVEKIKRGESVELSDLTLVVSELLNKYHNQKCDEPGNVWISQEEIEILYKLLGFLQEGIKEIEKIDD
ncbi:hypothetical protein J2S74_002988 [Evansella vedderi]|uniref:Uncharacterized protein n=1 Tax=Evansella vedderi TaxID=38282 RepID=A0ABT9ZWK6_9BACI|nr:hypothetical protein [Evansella vedderi]MDQ0255606.1 hypothetical protein [Evansella vedderi]